MSASDQRLIDAYRATGRIAFVYPRLGMISLNGGKRLPWREAIARIQQTISHAPSA